MAGRRRLAARGRHGEPGAAHALGASGADDRDRGGAPVTVWPGGGITFMVDVTLMPENSFGYVPTPAIVAPIEFTLRLDDYAALGGHVDEVRPLDEVVAQHAERPNTIFASGAVARVAGARRKA